MGAICPAPLTIMNSELLILSAIDFITAGGVNLSFSPQITKVGIEIFCRNGVVSVLPAIASKQPFTPVELLR